MNRVYPSLLLALSLGVASCAVDAEPLESTPITNLEVQRLSLDTQLGEHRDQLASSGYSVQLEEGLVYRRGDAYAAVFPIASEAGGACEYSTLTYQEAAGRVHVFLERGEPAAAPPSAPSPTPANLTCGSWSGWTTLQTWCDNVFPSCLFEGFRGKLRREWRTRTCCGATSCWPEYEYQTSLASCGC
jgi:hypothetical protein